MVDGGIAARYDYALQALSEVRYDVWRDLDPEDSLRFGPTGPPSSGFLMDALPQRSRYLARLFQREIVEATEAHLARSAADHISVLFPSVVLPSAASGIEVMGALAAGSIHGLYRCVNHTVEI
jgi:hypothetical protein